MTATLYDSPTRTAQKEATRHALKNAAVGLFGRQGFAATRIDHITEAAGVAKGTFYVHFADKDALLDEMLTEFNEGFVAHLAPLFGEAGAGDVRKIVQKLADLFLDYWEANRDFIRVYAEKAAGGMTLETLQFGVNPQMQAALRQLLAGVAPARKSVHEIDLIIQGLLALWLRLGLQCLFNPEVQRKTVTRTLVAMTTGALAAVLE